jgi:hypothetical protein
VKNSNVCFEKYLEKYLPIIEKDIFIMQDNLDPENMFLNLCSNSLVCISDICVIFPD